MMASCGSYNPAVDKFVEAFGLTGRDIFSLTLIIAADEIVRCKVEFAPTQAELDRAAIVASELRPEVTEAFDAACSNEVADDFKRRVRVAFAAEEERRFMSGEPSAKKLTVFDTAEPIIVEPKL